MKSSCLEGLFLLSILQAALNYNWTFFFFHTKKNNILSVKFHTQKQHLKEIVVLFPFPIELVQEQHCWVLCTANLFQIAKEDVHNIIIIDFEYIFPSHEDNVGVKLHPLMAFWNFSAPFLMICQFCFFQYYTHVVSVCLSRTGNTF